jgi:pre-rRNA-processing protein TSR1
MPGPSNHGQRNKAHNHGKHQSKHTSKLHKVNKTGSGGKHFVAKTNLGVGNKRERLVRAKQARDANKRMVSTEKRLEKLAPKVVAVMTLDGGDYDASDLRDFLGKFANSCERRKETADEGFVVAEKLFNDPHLPQTVRVELHDHRFQIMLVDHGHKLAALEAIKSADVLVCLASAHSKKEEKYDPPNEQLVESTMPTLRAQGLPPTVVVLRNSIKVSPSERNAARKLGMRIATEEILSVPKDRVKSQAVDTEQEMKMLVRMVCEQRAQAPAWRTQRPYIISEVSVIEPVSQHLSNLVVEGYVRGCGASANQLFHVPGVGDFPLEKIELIEERVTKKHNKSKNSNTSAMKNSSDLEMEKTRQETLETFVPDAEKREPVIRENKPPNDVEYDEDAHDKRLEHLKWEDAEKKKMMMRLKPKGWSDYQASWLPRDESDDEGSLFEEDGEEDADQGDFIREEDAEMDDGGAKTTKENDGNNDDGDDEMMMTDDHEEGDIEYASDEEEQEHWDGDLQGDISSDDDEETLKNLLEASKDSAKRARLRALEDENFEYPDEVEFPEDVEARRRFAKYKGLKSFRTSPWDPKENLPRDYARAFALASYKRLGKRSKEYLETNTDLDVGSYVRVTIKGVPTVCLENLLDPQSSTFYSSKIPSSEQLQIGDAGGLGEGVGQPWRGWTGGAGALVVSGLLRHESRMTVMHFGVQKRKEYTDPIPSKHSMWWHVGFRREKAKAIFSHDGLNADKFKFERFLPPRVPAMASLFMPITFGPAPVLGFSEKIGAGGAIQTALVCSGNVRAANPDRIALKRVVLTGFPFRTHKHKGVIRYMFFNAEDVKFFSPLELWTKYGRRGKITDALGTHGHMKCLFNGVILQHDTVCVTMYKRMFPKLERHQHNATNQNNEIELENRMHDAREFERTGDKMQMY